MCLCVIDECGLREISVGALPNVVAARQHNIPWREIVQPRKYVSFAFHRVRYRISVVPGYLQPPRHILVYGISDLRPRMSGINPLAQNHRARRAVINRVSHVVLLCLTCNNDMHVAKCAWEAHQQRVRKSSDER